MNRYTALSNAELLERARRLARIERVVAAEFIACLSFIDARNAALDAGYPNLWAFCVEDLKLSEASASKRVRTARAARRCIELLSYLRNGEISIDAAAMVAPFLDGSRALEVLESAKGKSIREVERLLASMAPRPDVADSIRKASVPEAAAPPRAEPELALSSGLEHVQGEPAAPAPPSQCPPAPPPGPTARREALKPLSPGRVHFSFTGSDALRLAVERMRALTRHKFPAGRLEDLVLEAISFYLEKRDPALKTPARRPDAASEDAGSRRIPQWVKDEVLRRDGGACAYVSEEGRRCGATDWLEYDHIRPWAFGGLSADPTNVRLLCRAHNQRAADLAGLGRTSSDGEARNAS